MTTEELPAPEAIKFESYLDPEDDQVYFCISLYYINGEKISLGYTTDTAVKMLANFQEHVDAAVLEEMAHKYKE